MANFTCPFCHREYDKSKVLYICRSCGEAATPKTFEAEPIKCKNEKCKGKDGGIADVRRCPECGREIPQEVLKTQNLLFSIVGIANSGKTNYITVMLEELRQTHLLKLSLEALNDETRNHQYENRRLILEEKTVLEATNSGIPEPQIWKISNLHRQSDRKTSAYTFTIYDGAGEDYENHFNPSSDLCRYIKVSKAIILTLDPLVLSNIKKGGVVDPDDMTNSLGGHEGSIKIAEEVINSAAKYIKSAKGIEHTQKINVPVAVVLTKFDTILEHKAFGEQALIRSKESSIIRDGKFDITEIKQVHEYIREWLEAINERSFINTLKTHFKEFIFFGVSSYGTPPINDKTLASDIEPQRVLDPILWLFKKFNFID